MKIKTFWKSLDLRNNKILNAKVETPTEDSDIAPKGYVDDSTKYDTVKAEQFPQGSPKFSWMNFSLKDKTFKELFDALFFPVVLPIYTEVVFEKVTVTALGEYGNNLFLSRQTQFNVDYVINRGDRQSTTIPKIRVTTKSPVTVTDYNGNTSGNTGNFNFTLNLQNVDKIELIKTFEDVDVPKLDNYGNPYIPTEFTQNYDATYDVLSNILENYKLQIPIIYRKLTPNEDVNTILATIINGDSMSTPMTTTLATFVKDRKLFTTADDNNYFLFGIPKTFFNNYQLNVKITDSATKPVSSFDLNNDVMLYFDTKTLKYYGVDNEYFFFTLDFGYHEVIKEINLSMNKFKQA